MGKDSVIDDYLKDSLTNAIIKSQIPESAKKNPCIIGVDEAGRGPVLGPMVYGVAFYPKNSEDILAKMKFADSKALTDATRENLFEQVEKRDGSFKDLGYVVKILAPNMISNCMLRRQKYNLNTLSHDTVIELLQQVVSQGVTIEHVYIDTVGPPHTYQQKLKKFFPNISFTVTDKADSKFPIVSAASVVAKVIRDRIIANWKYPEADSLFMDAFELGSGYPSDPKTKLFLQRSVDRVFGFPTIARFSWSTITNALKKDGCTCDWNEPDDDNQPNQEQVKKNKEYWKKKFMATKPAEIATRNAKVITNGDKFFQDRKLTRVFNELGS